MYDYLRLFIEDPEQINTILNNPLFEFKQEFEKNTAEVYQFPQEATWMNWEIRAFSPTYMVITGSIHKFFTNGTNANDFTFYDAVRAIKMFCDVFQLNPRFARVTNLEFGVNVRPLLNASEIIDQVICFKNTRPIRPYESRPDYFFIEFDVGDYYVKIYDKGKQYKGPNVLRFEIKAVKNRFLEFAGITTLQDLTSISTMNLLGVKINEFFTRVVFNDRSIELKTLTKPERKNYLLMKDPNEWARHKKKKTSTHRYREDKFREIVKMYGKDNIQSNLQDLIKVKTNELTQVQTLAVFTSKYMVKCNQNLTITEHLIPTPGINHKTAV